MKMTRILALVMALLMCFGSAMAEDAKSATVFQNLKPAFVWDLRTVTLL